MKVLNLMIAILITLLFTSSCRKFLEVEAPKGSLVKTSVFQEDGTATSAMLGIYSQMAAGGYASGNFNSLSVICGMSADEYLPQSTLLTEFYNNQIDPLSNTLSTVWTNIYLRIYSANTVLEGLTEQTGVTSTLKTQLQGEAYFTRAFNYFYLVNLFGEIPLHLTSSYQENSTTIKSDPSAVYQQILKDLKQAEGLLGEEYITSERIRPNKSAVQAMLARVYLYLKDWDNAEKYSSLVLDKVALYELKAPDEIFLKNSKEAIWQLMPTANTNTLDGNALILPTTAFHVSLNSSFATNRFEVNDKRKTSWIRSAIVAGVLYYYPFKYKVKSSSTVTEYSMVLRLAEQYLIRAEARAQQNKLTLAVADLDKIRIRAGIVPIQTISPGIGQNELLNLIYKERQVELFSEWGHRWLDLKRLGLADAVLKTVKSNWQLTDVLYPIPQNEINRNQKINQNNGY